MFFALTLQPIRSNFFIAKSLCILTKLRRPCCNYLTTPLFKSLERKEYSFLNSVEMPTATFATDNAALAKLNDLCIQYEHFPHAPTRTTEELKHVFDGKPFQQAKNVFLVDKRKRLYLVTALVDSVINLKALSTKLAAPGFRFASEELMRKHLNVTPGSVTPLALLNDEEKAVTLVLDNAFKQSSQPILVHPLHNEASVALSLSDLVKYVEAAEHKITWVDLQEEAAGGEGTKPSKAIDTRVEAGTLSTGGGQGTEMLGITAKKNENFSEWYSQIITRADMVEYYDVSGCYILRPWSYFMWETIQEFFNIEIKKIGVQNCYFPMFVTKKRLETEQNHVEGFSPEVAWVTKYGETDLAEPIAIRPTSETIMYPAYARWIRSHRDLPLKLNQWCQAVRWEFKQPTPFIRTREFLWQEGHTAHATDSEAETFVFKILNTYNRIYEELLAVPVVKGIKSENEKFAGGKMTTTVEAFIPTNGRAVQAATSHHLGTNFSKMFGIHFEDSDKVKQYVHQTSWGFTTRSLGVAVMVHGDDKGMVMPPRVAPVQVAIIPIIYKEAQTEDLLKRCHTIADQLTEVGIRVKVDDRDNYTAGWKYNDWETKGVCLRMEIGPKDMKAQSARLVRRDTNDKSDHPWNTLPTVIPELLKTIHTSMLAKAKKQLEDSIVKITSWDQVMPALNDKKLVLAPWCEEPESEEYIKKETTRLSLEAADESKGLEEGATSLTGAMKALCIPLDQEPLPSGATCFVTGKPARRWCLFGRSY